MRELGRRSRLALAGLACFVVVLVLARAIGGTPTASSLATSAPPTSSTTDQSTSTAPGTPTTPPVTTADPLTVVALGDSVPSASTCDCTGYVEQLGASLHSQTGRPVTVHNDATDGWTTADVGHDLSSPSTAGHLAAADLVVIEVGANDFDLDRVDDPTCLPASTSPCWATTMADLRTGLADIVAGVHRLDTRADLQIAVLGYWNVTLDGAVGAARGPAFVAGSDALTRAVNAAIESTASQLGALYVDAYTPFKGDGSGDPTSSLLADGDHPDAEGHALLAGAVLDALRSAGAVEVWTPAVSR